MFLPYFCVISSQMVSNGHLFLNLLKGQKKLKTKAASVQVQKQSIINVFYIDLFLF
jgi:hypothetical protein